MKRLLEKSNINQADLRNFIVRTAATELTNLAEPCYFPPVKKDYYELLNLCQLKESDVKEVFKDFFKDSPNPTAFLIKDPGTCTLIFIMHYFLIKKDQLGFSSTMLYYMIRQYRHIMSNSFPKYCKEEVWKYTLDHIAKTHLFSREKTIPNAIYFLSKEMIKSYTDDLQTEDANRIFKFIFESRSRLSQSCHSFAELYYKADAEGLGYKKPFEPDQETGEEYQVKVLEKGQRIASDVAKNITVYKFVDKKAEENARKITKVSSNLTNLIITSLTNVKFTDNIRMIIELYLRDVKDIKQICGKDFIPYIRSLMSIKRTTKQIYFKQQVIELTESLVDEMNFRDRYDNLSNQTQFLISSFIAFYITMVVRNMVCGANQKF